jgi:hypothetical protein
VDFNEVGSDEYYGYHPYDICYQYNVELEPNEVFWQDDYNDMTEDNIYWLSIVALYQTDLYPDHPWGWKTRPWHWMDDAVTFQTADEPNVGFVTNPLNITPIVDPQWNESFDMAFELDTDPNYIKWEQLYTGIRHWPHYEDVNSTLNTSDPNNEQLVADDWRCLRRTPITAIAWWGSYIGYGYEACSYGPFMPLPISPNSFNLKIWTDVPVGETITVAAGSSNGYVYVYDGSGNSLWNYDTGADVASVDVSVDGSYIAVGSYQNKLYLFDRSGTLLWQKDALIEYSYGGGWMGEESKSVSMSAYGEYVAAACSNGLFVYNKNGTLNWSDPNKGTCVDISPDGNYIVVCDESSQGVRFYSIASSTPLWTINRYGYWVATSNPGYVAMSTTGGSIYLYDNAGTQIWSYSPKSGYVRVDMPEDGLSVVGVNDDPSNSQGCELNYFSHLKDGTAGWSAADGTPVWMYDPGGSGSDFYSVAISGDGEYISTGPSGGSYVFPKDSNVPLQTLSMGSANSYELMYDGQYGACGNREGELYYFSKDSNTPSWNKTLGGIVHTVGLGTNLFSHPGEIIWEYDAAEYDEVLVGYDKHPHGEPNEPVFRYSVRLPEEDWFHQPDYNGIFWLSVQAVYDANQPKYPWGWTNHKHVFNDDAVQGRDDAVLGLVWNEVKDQTGASADMSFMLFTDPNECSTCANYNLDANVNFIDYAEFANQWCWSGPAGGYNNADLDCDGDVDLYDLGIFCQQWLQYCP